MQVAGGEASKQAGAIDKDDDDTTRPRITTLLTSLARCDVSQRQNRGDHFGTTLATLTHGPPARMAIIEELDARIAPAGKFQRASVIKLNSASYASGTEL